MHKERYEPRASTHKLIACSSTDQRQHAIMPTEIHAKPMRATGQVNPKLEEAARARPNTHTHAAACQFRTDNTLHAFVSKVNAATYSGSGLAHGKKWRSTKWLSIGRPLSPSHLQPCRTQNDRSSQAKKVASLPRLPVPITRLSL